MSVAADGTQGNSRSGGAWISADGRYVGFSSNATNLVPGDTNGVGDSFVYDCETGAIERVSVASDGTQGNGNSAGALISADGRYVAYHTDASNLVPGDTNGITDVLVYDRQMHTVERVSVAANGTQANSFSWLNSMSADGRYVAFQSGATNLVPGDTNGEVWDVFVYDRQTDKIQLVSVAADGTLGSGFSSGASLSADGRYVVFDTSSDLVSGDTNGDYDIFVTANPFAWAPGSHVVTLSGSQIVSGIDFGNTSSTKFYVVNDATQNLTYEYNSRSSLVESYSLNSGNTAPRGVASTIAGDKTWVVDANRKVYVYSNSGALLGSWTAGTLATSATVEGIGTDGTDVWIVDAKSDKVFRYAQAASRLSGSQNAASSFSLNSGNTSPKDIVTDGISLWVVNDSTSDKVFKYTTAGALVGSWTITTSGATKPTGITIDPANVSHIWIVDSGTDRVYFYYKGANTSSESQKFAQASFALAVGNTNPQGIADPPAPSAELLTSSIAVGYDEAIQTACTGMWDGSSGTSVSLNSHKVMRSSVAQQVATTLHNTFVYDRETRTIERVSVAADGTQGNNASWGPSVSADGRYVSFGSTASNLIPGGTNGKGDIFVRDRQTHSIERVSVANDGTQANAGYYSHSMSANGRYVTINSIASNLVPGDTNDKLDVFVYDRQADTIERVSVANDGTQGNESSYNASLSADGHYVAFRSFASNLVPGDTNGNSDIFVYDLQTHSIESVTHASDGASGNGNVGSYGWISGDGRYVAFGSTASNLIPGDTNGVSDGFVTANPFAWPSGSHEVVLAEGQDVSGIAFGNHDIAAPTGDIVNVTPDPRTSAVSSVTIIFSEAVTGLDVADLALTRGGGSNLLTDAQTLSTVDNVTWVLEDLSSLTSTAGNYQLQLTAEGAGIADLSGNALVADASDSWTVYATVSRRQIFYNNSAFDKNSAAANADDDAAIATDKQILLPGGTATIANYTSYSRGLNGLMIDVHNLPATPTVEDFLFRMGNDDKPYGTDLNNPADDWPWAPAPIAITVRAGAGLDGAERVTVIWADGVIHNCWLQVTLRATDNTGLVANEVFYVGNAVGESGNSTTDALVNATDEIGARNNPHGPFTPAPLDDRYDYNRDKLVNATDQILARNNRTSPFTALKLITPPLDSGGGEGEGEGEALGFRLQASGSSLKPDMENLNPVTIVPLLNPSVFQRVTTLPDTASDQHPTSRLSSAAAGDQNLAPAAGRLQPGAESQVHVAHVYELDQHDQLVRRIRWAAEHAKEDERDALAVALTELLEEWTQF